MYTWQFCDSDLVNIVGMVSYVTRTQKSLVTSNDSRSRGGGLHPLVFMNDQIDPLTQPMANLQTLGDYIFDRKKIQFKLLFHRPKWLWKSRCIATVAVKIGRKESCNLLNNQDDSMESKEPEPFFFLPLFSELAGP